MLSKFQSSSRTIPKGPENKSPVKIPETRSQPKVLVSPFAKISPDSIIEIPYETNSERGILANLSGNILISASSTTSGAPENVLNWSNTSWFSMFRQGGWICFHFPHNQVSVSGYRIRFYQEHGYVAKGWKVEASKDQREWVKIDEQSNSIPPPGREGFFQCIASEFMNSIKFTQTKKRIAYNDFYFCLEAIELFGSVNLRQ